MGREEEIRELCDRWLEASRTDTGGTTVGQHTRRFRLRENGISPPDVTYGEMRALGVGLTRVLLSPKMGTVIDLDHYLYWSWAGELLLEPSRGIFSPEENELRALFEVAIRSAMASVRGSSGDPRTDRQMDEVRRLITPFHQQQLMENNHLILAYLSLPLLEGMLKKACSDYVAMDGTVLQEFEGAKGTYETGNRCSRMKDMLVLARTLSPSESLRNDLEAVGAHLTQFQVSDEDAEPFAVIGDWRNESLHGETTHPTIGGTVLTLAILVGLSELSDRYEALADEARGDVERRRRQMEFSNGLRAPWEFFPPVL